MSIEPRRFALRQGADHLSDTTSHALNDNGRAALDYAARGWHVFPLHSVRDGVCTCREGSDCIQGHGKHPRTASGFKDASSDPDQLRSWWTRWPDANVGIRTGAESGIVVLDVDVKSGGLESLDALLNEHGPLPRTPGTLTGGGGRHFIFAHPGAEVANSAGKVAPGLDVRGDGGYVVAPPSIHATGQAYRWDFTARPEDVPPAPIPDWLLDLMLGKGKGAAVTERRRVDLAVVLQGVPEGERNDTLYRAVS